MSVHKCSLSKCRILGGQGMCSEARFSFSCNFKEINLKYLASVASSSMRKVSPMCQGSNTVQGA